MAMTLHAALDSRLSRDGFNLSDRIGDVAKDFAARGFSLPSGPLYGKIDDLCSLRMEQVAEMAISVYQECRATGTNEAELKADLVDYLNSRLNSIMLTALGSYNRPTNQAAQASLESAMRQLIAKAERY